SVCFACASSIGPSPRVRTAGRPHSAPPASGSSGTNTSSETASGSPSPESRPAASKARKTGLGLSIGTSRQSPKRYHGERHGPVPFAYRADSRYSARRMAAIRKVSISTGMYWIEVRGADVRMLCGCPEDAVKHLLRTGLIVPVEVKGVACETGPNAILLSDLAIQNGRVCSRSEFPVLQMLYNQGMIVPDHPRNTGQRPLLIGSRRQVDAQMAYIFQIG